MIIKRVFNKIKYYYFKLFYNNFMLIRNCIKGERDYALSLQELQQLRNNHSNLSPYELINKYIGYGEYKDIRAKQIPFEIESLYNQINSYKPRIICEIGTYKGGTLYILSQAAADDALIISIDLPPGLNNAYTPNRQYFYQHFAIKQQCICCIPGDSHSANTKERLKTLLGGRKIEFLFIDGDHSYNGVRMDFEMYAPLVKQGGLIAFHDILPRPELVKIEVFKLWKELKKKYEFQEIIDSHDKKIGIGVIKWRS
ncbi:hypothetical protein GMMP1_580023 [Candidatus Magnetomoraceae bacterium gMMP-1]